MRRGKTQLQARMGLTDFQRQSVSVSDYLRTEIYFPVLDKVVSEINRRFSSESQSVLKAICALKASDMFL